MQREIWRGQCPQCWTACEAYQSILGNVLAGRCPSRRMTDPHADSRGIGDTEAEVCQVNVICFTDAVIQAHLEHAVAHHVASDVSAVIAAKQEAPSIADIIDRTRRYAGEVIVVVGHSTDGTPDLAQRRGARVLVDGWPRKG